MFVGHDRFPRLYIGKSNLKKVYERGFDGKEMLAQPFCGLDNMGQMGVGVYVYDSATEELCGGWFWGMLQPRDLVASYRGMKILEMLPEIKGGTLCETWHAGVRKVHTSDQEKLNSVIARIGQSAYQELLSEPLPSFEDAIAVLKERGISIAAFPFEEELRAGTLTLTPALQELGVEDPAIIDARREHAQRLLDPYQRHIQQYLRTKGHSSRCFLASHIELYVIEGVVKGIKETDLVVGNAIVAGHYQSSLSVLSLMPMPGTSRFIDKLLERTIQEVASYLARKYGAEESNLKKGFKKLRGWLGRQTATDEQTTRTTNDYIRLLTDIRDRWNDMPQVIQL